MTVSYTVYLVEPPSRFLDERVDPEAAERARLEALHRIDYLMQSLVEDLADLLPAGYTIETTKEVP